MIKKLLFFLLIAVILLSAFLLINTFRQGSVQPMGEASLPPKINAEMAANRLAKAISFRTISAPEYYSDSAFVQFHSFLKESYPEVFAQMELQSFGKHTMLLKWPGKNEQLSPLLFLGHQDVVPVEEANYGKWRVPPFGGIVAYDTIYGRGAVDDKCTVLGLLEASTVLLKNGFAPERTIYFCFGEDEEVLGGKGAFSVAEHFRNMGVQFEAIWDEGGVIGDGLVPGIENNPVALIGVAEKGFLSVTLTVEMEGGHSSMPARETAVGVLSKAIVNLQNNPFPERVSAPLEGFIEFMGPELPFVQRMAFANQFLMEGLILNAYGKKASSRAMIQTTMAPTVMQAGVKDNVLPSEAKAIVNLRILPGETIEGCMDYLKKTIADERVRIEPMGKPSNPSGVSEHKSKAFKELAMAVKDVYPNALVTPFLLIGASDSRHFDGLSPNIYKFIPITFSGQKLGMIHGANERVSKADYKRAIEVYAQCIYRWSRLN